MRISAQKSLRGFAVAMASANRHRTTLKSRFGYSDEQISAIADLAIRKERIEFERGEIKRLGAMIRKVKARGKNEHSSK
jgi:hypothetical protein